MKDKRPAMSMAMAIAVLLFILVPCCTAQIDALSPLSQLLPPPPPLAQFTAQLNTKIAELTRSFYPEVKKLAGFCIKDLEADYNHAFNFSSDVKFLSDCFESSNDFSERICTAAEIKAYFLNFYSRDGSAGSLNPNRNCNLTSYVSGCESGWGCSLNEEQSNDKDIDLTQADNMPLRTHDCKPCCAGFFCPFGITCMIPCPLGSYCPTAKLNQTTGFCEPYKYQPPPGRPNHTCGGADVWADVGSSIDMFCEEGSYCPSTVEKYDCPSGSFCRLGSTSTNRCFAGSCKANSGHQDMKIFSAIFVVALSLLLVIVYNCSDRILAFRERRLAKSRENAARIVRESAVAREKWKTAKEGAMKHVFQLQAQLSRKFSRQRIAESDEEYILSDIVHEPEESPEIEDVPTEIEEVKIKKKIPKVKKAHTPSQIFRYAYGEIEKEKSIQDENKNLTFSQVVSRATTNEIRTRPVIEIAFKDLTLVLKRSKKQLLKYVTGKLEPGHVTAVMGPSGAGKTTFLTALSGNTAGCEITGSVLINGKKDPIRAYKKLIGFVPQDDIVHGNLTVEENLWFSARCRLSVNMSRADKVLVVERTINCLGLQAIRDSLVGTVEQRGISGGQRKRVNVGLEMVMEPSLLILDEPTSGLDSSSSQLLLRALRREALEGVNVSAVIHQPSYTLFNMFDDLILLAKGGLIAYHGPVKKVEQYFESLGIIVPERVNPPDYYIDILEGMQKTDSRIKYNQLPLIWMLRNGYNIPAKMQDELNSIDRSILSGQSNPIRSESEDLSNEAASNSEAHPAAKQAKSNYNFYRAKDLANRRTPGILVQYRYYLGRVTKQRLREAGSLAVDLLILGLAGVCLGLIAKVSDQNMGVPGYIYTVIAVSLLCQIAALKSFSLEKLQFMRERSSGMSSLAYFLARDTIDHFSTVFKPAIYLSMFYFLTNPRSSFTDNYIIMLALIYCVTGIGYAFAICFQPSSAQLWSALLPVVLTLLATQKGASKVLTSLCYPKWALEAFVIVNAERYPGVWLITRCAALYTRQYNINHFGLCIGVLFLYGVVFRCIAFLFMVLLLKK